MDGAMGTELFRAGVPRDACLEELNLTQPEVVRRIHRAYVDAGAEVLVTNTFQANPDHLKKYKLHERIDAIYQGALDAARCVARTNTFVLADVGSMLMETAVQYVPFSVPDRELDGLLLETWQCPELARMVADIDWAVGSRLPALVSFAFSRSDGSSYCKCNGLHQTLHTPVECAAMAQNHHFAALGVNCGADICRPELLEILAAYRSVTELPLFVRPNAGTPKQIDGQWVYPETPESMAAWLPDLFNAGVVMVGGCCGTRPAHIAAFRKVVDEWNRARDFSSQ